MSLHPYALLAVQLSAVCIVFSLPSVMWSRARIAASAARSAVGRATCDSGFRLQ